jgi:hypothetical protein
MPRLPIDYQKTVIYKIVCNDLSVTFSYVGMTTDFTNRKRGHKNTCNNITLNKSNLKVYQTIRANGGWDNWNMLTIEMYPCNNDIEARLREREWYEKLNANMNTIRPLTTNEEYKKDKQLYDKQYAETHKEEKQKYKKQYYEDNKEEIKLIAETHKEEKQKYRKQYYEDNKEQLKQSQKQYKECHKEDKRLYNKQYAENNKEKINAKRKENRERKKNKTDII